MKCFIKRVNNAYFKTFLYIFKCYKKFDIDNFHLRTNVLLYFLYDSAAILNKMHKKLTLFTYISCFQTFACLLLSALERQESTVFLQQESVLAQKNLIEACV